MLYGLYSFDADQWSRDLLSKRWARTTGEAERKEAAAWSTARACPPTERASPRCRVSTITAVLVSPDPISRRLWPRVAVGLGLLAAGVCATLVATDPHGIGRRLVPILGLVLPLVVAAGPLVHGARPRKVWNFHTLGCVCVALAVLVPWATRGEPAGFHDLWLLAARLAFITWLVLMARHLGRPSYHYVPVLDVIAVTLCALLWMWPLLLAPLLGRPQLSAGLIDTAFLMLDATILTMAVEVVYQVQRLTTSHRLLLWGVILHVALEPAFAVEAVHPGRIPAIVLAAEILPVTLLICSAWHPSVRFLVNKTDKDSDRQPSAGTVSLTMGNTVPIVVAVVAPTHGTIDIAVRVACIIGILGTLAVRLWGTMRALGAAQAESHYRATHDQLTGLLNRAALFDALAHVLESNAATGRHTAVLFSDCDGFKQINDRWGHHTGDKLLAVVADRMASYPGSFDALARHGGDEFVAVMSVDSVGEAEALAEWMRSAFAEPVALSDAVVHHLTSSIGIAVSPPDPRTTTDDILRWADTAMYSAKARGRGQYVVAEHATPPGPDGGSTAVPNPA